MSEWTYRCHVLDKVRAEDVVGSYDSPLHMRYTFHLDARSIAKAQAITLGEIENVITATVGR